MIWRSLILSVALTGAAHAQQADLSEGRFVMFANHWSDEANAFVQGPPQGSETACFAVGETTADGVQLTLQSGTYYVWWDDRSVTEYADVWFSSDRFREDYPGSDLLAELRVLFRNVEGC